MDPKFGSFAIYEHCLPFNVSRAFDEASGIDDPVILGPRNATERCGKRCRRRHVGEQAEGGRAMNIQELG